MKVRGGKRGKRVATYQLTSEPRRLPPPNGLCNLETGPETFQLITSSDAQAAQLKGFIGKEISVKVDEVACAQDAGQMSEAVITKWSVVTSIKWCGHLPQPDGWTRMRFASRTKKPRVMPRGFRVDQTNVRSIVVNRLQDFVTGGFHTATSGSCPTG